MTITEMYDPQRMPNDLRIAHSENDAIVDRIYIGRLFKNDTERLEKFFSFTMLQHPTFRRARIDSLQSGTRINLAC